MQRTENKLYIANATSESSRPRPVAPSLAARIANTTASQRLSLLMVGAMVAAATPVLANTIASTVSFSVSVLVEFSHIGLVAFQLLGR